MNTSDTVEGKQDVSKIPAAAALCMVHDAALYLALLLSTPWHINPNANPTPRMEQHLHV